MIVIKLKGSKLMTAAEKRCELVILETSDIHGHVIPSTMEITKKRTRVLLRSLV